ncbi:hypothetical protein [Neorhodopirellula pilleata]|uniref:Leucine Rich repeats (2 copies) n=1 Tax=Neorhodopirellula pilleata TaxID=2714738 RepID=A0A5C6A6X4_9BACT|nr:hypothetical protein [Neorhodopirellula pilleata]TWT95644.1 hypothetical protein Pla100_32850 [Neorhodopirellula pilleata]
MKKGRSKPDIGVGLRYRRHLLAVTCSPHLLEATSLNHSDQQRQLVRTIVCGCLLTAIFLYLSSPRMVLHSFADWFPSESSEINTVQVSMRHSVTGQSGVGPTTTAPPHADLEPTAIEPRKELISWSVAGFPFDAIHFQETLTTRTHFVSGLALCLDALAFLLVVGGGSVLAYYYHVPIRHRMPMFIVWTALLVIFASGVGWLFWESSSRMIGLARLGKLTQVETVSHAAFRWLPKTLRQPWNHLYGFDQYPLHAPSDPEALPYIRTFPSDTSEFELVDLIARHPAIQAIALEGKLGESMRQTLGSLKFLHTLHWEGVSDSQSVANLLDKTQGLISLRMSFAASKQRSAEANASESQPAFKAQLDFRTLPHLQELWISGVNQSELVANGLTHPELEQLSLEFAGDNRVPVVVSGLPKLRSLQLAAARSARSNVAIEVRHVPELRTLMVPVFRPINLQVENAPKLKSISTTFRTRRDLQMSSADYAPWFTSLDIQNASSLMELSLTTVFTRHWNIQGCPNLHRLELSQPSQRRSSLLNADRLERVLYGGDTATANNENLAPVWRWLQNALPLNEISIEQLDLRQVDFATWSKMKFLEKICLVRCVTEPSQIKQLASITSLTQIHASDIRVDDETVEELLAGPQRWEDLNLDWTAVREIRIVDQPRLCSAFGTRPLDATSVHLVNLPRLDAKIQLRRKVDELVIENVPGIASLILFERLPANAIISGIPGLREFCVRRSVLNAEQCEALSRASNLQTLRLPQCQVPSNLLSDLSKWKRLMAIDWTDLRIVDVSSQPRPLGDEDCQSLGLLEGLIFANLDRSHVGVDTVRQLSYCDQLQALSLVGCLSTGDELAPLLRLKSLMELRVEASLNPPSELNEAIEGWGEGDFQEIFANAWGGRQFTSRVYQGTLRDLFLSDQSQDNVPPAGRMSWSIQYEPYRNPKIGMHHNESDFKPSPNRVRKLAARGLGQPVDAAANTSPR